MKDSFQKLVELNKKLRKECSWDGSQTIFSYAKHIKEESEEVLEAIEKNDAHELKEELGDVLYNVLFLIEIADEIGLFNGKELLDETHEKMVRRHPHIYENYTEDIDEIWRLYREVKAKEKENKLKIPLKKIINVPTVSECVAMWNEVDLPDNVRRHSIMVTRVAVALAKRLKEKGEKVDVDLVRSATLLHDLDKIITLDNIPEHGKIAKKMLAEKGYGYVGFTAEKHVLQPHIDCFVSIEEKVIYYADKVCKEDKIVTIAERIDYLNKKYPDLMKKMSHAESQIREIEKEILDKAGIKIEDIPALIEADNDDVRNIKID